MNHWNWHIGFVKFLRRHHHSNLSNLAEIMPEIKIKKTEKRHFHRKWWMKRGKKLSHCCFLDSFPMLLSNYILISTINLLNNYVHTIRRLFSLNSSVNISNSNAFFSALYSIKCCWLNLKDLNTLLFDYHNKRSFEKAFSLFFLSSLHLEMNMVPRPFWRCTS